ncbi:hypothetical protein GQ600_21210 [Phytophthora cactorum]|nr:hypothetical protein GQ600_21210 [Phytophthora cactorum]
MMGSTSFRSNFFVVGYPQALGRNVSVSFVFRRRRFADDEGPRDPSIAKRPSLPASPSSTPMEVDDNGGRTRKDAGGDSRRDEPSFDFSSGDTAGEEAVPAPTEGSSSAGGAGDASSPARSDVPGGEGSPADTGRPVQTKGPTGISFSYTSPKNTIAANFSSTSIAASRLSKALVRSLTIRELSTVGPTILGHAIHCSWSQELLRACLSRVLPDPTPGDVVIRVTIESLRAFFDYEDPNHPWQIMRQLLPEEPCLFDIAGFDPKAHVSKRAPYETRIKVLWANFRGDGPKPDLGFALWERYHWILAGAVEKGFAREASDPNHDRTLLKNQYMKWCLESVTVPRHSFIRPELIVEPSVPSYPVEPLPLVPKTTDWLAEAAALERRQPWRAAWVFAPSTTHTTPRTFLATMTRQSSVHALQTPLLSVEPLCDPSLTPAQLVPDWQRRFFSAPGSLHQPSAAASAGGGNDGSSASGPHQSPRVSSRRRREG